LRNKPRRLLLESYEWRGLNAFSCYTPQMVPRVSSASRQTATRRWNISGWRSAIACEPRS